VRGAFQLVKFKQVGGEATIFDVLYGRRFTVEDLASQPARMVLFESLLYDNEIEWSSMKKQSGGGGSGNIIVPGKSTMEIKQMVFDAKYPEYRNAVVTLLTTKEYLEIASATKNHYRDLSR
jgi:hypothetical protein